MKTKVFGPPCAVLNISRLGYNYVKAFYNAADSTIERMKLFLMNHPNVMYALTTKGWSNFCVSIIYKDNLELKTVLHNINRLLLLTDEIKIICQSVSILFWNKRPFENTCEPLSIVDPVVTPTELSVLELDYLKLITINGGFSPQEVAQMLNTSESNVNKLEQELTGRGIIVGYRERVNFPGHYFKVFVNTQTAKTATAETELRTYLTASPNCIYTCESISKYDFEFEYLAESLSDAQKLVSGFSDCQFIYDMDYFVSDQLPVSKTANLNEIKESLINASGSVIDLKNSKLWYATELSAEAYMGVDDEPIYAAKMKNANQAAYKLATDYVNVNYPNKKFQVCDIGCGNGKQGLAFNQLLGADKIEAYFPIDIQMTEINRATHEHKDMHYAIKPIVIDIEKMYTRLPLRNVKDRQQIYIFFGGTYGNFKNAKINAELKKLVAGSDNLVVITMPVYQGKLDEAAVVRAYTSMVLEDMCFGPFAHFGFAKSDFEPNPDDTKLIIRPMIKNDCNICTFKLKNKVITLGKSFEAGAVFEVVCSWKPSLQRFKQALEQNFDVKFFDKSGEMAIAVVGEKR
ncbi:MAG: L-histidine N(alpha)-methyltransferase [Firmicutes bacterium]|nr:L-histidine N(alpha)-methyltransferase [Bacillota bacterium]